MDKNENINYHDEEIKPLILENNPNKPFEIQDLIKEINNLKKKNDKLYEEMKKKNKETEEKWKGLEDEVLIMKNKI